MRLFIFLLSGLSLLGCGKDDDVGFTSLIGSWTYTTPDEKIKVTFDIVGGGSASLLAVENQTIEVDGENARAEIETVDITETSIKKIRINANDAALTFPYNITFNDLKANTDFTVLDVADATYTFPWPESQGLTNIQIVRK